MAKSDSHKTVARSASHFFTGTFISRFTGMVRDLSMAYCFGTSPAVAGFLVAFRLSNLLRRLFGEGALLNGFIPFFEAKRKEDEVQAALFFRDLFWSLSVVLFMIICLLEALLGFSLVLFTPSPEVKSIIYMAMIMLPGLVFICLFGLSMALLQCEKNFFLPGIAPVAFNLVWIASVWVFRSYPPYTAMLGISGGIVIAFFLQWWVTVPGVTKYIREFLSFAEWMKAKLFTRDLKDMVVPLMLGVVGVAAVQINSALDILMARFASLEGPAYLSYAHRLQQLPLALFGIAVASALMPPLTRAIKNDDYGQFRSLLTFGFARTFSLLLPGTIAIFVLGGASVNLLYGRGVFSNISTIYTTHALWGYGIGLVPSAFVLILAPAFYARRDFWTPTLASLLAMGLNFFLNCVMIFYMDLNSISIALSTSLTAIFNMWFLLKRLHVKVFADLMKPFYKVTIASIIAGVVTLFFGHFVIQDPSLLMFLGSADVVFKRTLVEQANQFLMLTGLYGVVFLLLSYILKAQEVLDLFSIKTKS